MKQRIFTMLTLLALLVTLFPRSTANAAVVSKGNEETGAEIIVRDGAVYTLYEVRTMPSVQTMTVTESEETFYHETETTVYVYHNATRGWILNGEKYKTTYSASGLKLFTIQQLTEWTYVDGVSATFLSAEHHAPYLADGVLVMMGTADISYDSGNDVTYMYDYPVFYESEMIDDYIFTTCTIYGELY